MLQTSSPTNLLASAMLDVLLGATLSRTHAAWHWERSSAVAVPGQDRDCKGRRRLVLPAHCLESVGFSIQLQDVAHQSRRLSYHGPLQPVMAEHASSLALAAVCRVIWGRQPMQLQHWLWLLRVLRPLLPTLELGSETARKPGSHRVCSGGQELCQLGFSRFDSVPRDPPLSVSTAVLLLWAACLDPSGASPWHI